MTNRTLGNEDSGVSSRAGIEANAVDGEGTNGASSRRNKVQLTATLLALFVRSTFSFLSIDSRAVLKSRHIALFVSRCPGFFNCYYRNPDYYQRPALSNRLHVGRSSLSSRQRCCHSSVGKALRYLGPEDHSSRCRSHLLCWISNMCSFHEYDKVDYRSFYSRYCCRWNDDSYQHMHQ